MIDDVATTDNLRHGFEDASLQNSTTIFRDRFDAGDADTVVETVVTGVARVSDTPTTQLPPLHEVIDPEALGNLFGQTSSGRPRGEGSVRFTFHDCVVTVSSAGFVTVRPASSSPEDSGDEDA